MLTSTTRSNGTSDHLRKNHKLPVSLTIIDVDMEVLDSTVIPAAAGGLEGVWGGAGFESSNISVPSSTTTTLKKSTVDDDEPFDVDEEEEDEDEEEEVCAAAEEAGLDVIALVDDEDYVESEQEEEMAAADEDDEMSNAEQDSDDDESEVVATSTEEDSTIKTIAAVQVSDVVGPGEAIVPAEHAIDQSQGRRPSRNANKAPVDYKALLDGPVVVKKIVRQRKQPYNEAGERVYCLCRKTDNGKFMIQCDSCKDWYHGSCIGITEKMARDIPSYECEECAEVRKENEVLLEERRRQQAEAARIRREKADAEARLKASRPDPITVATTAPSKATQRPSSARRAAPKTAEAVSPATFWVHGKQVIQPPTVAPASSSKRHSFSVNPLERKASVTSVTSLPSTPGYEASTPRPGESDVGPDSTAWQRDKVRSAVRKAFTDTFSAILVDPELQSALLEKDVNKIDPASFAAQVEDELFDFLSDGIRGHRRSCGEKYKGKFRTLQFNLKDKLNLSLRKRIAIGALSADVLVRLEAEDLANEEIKAKSEAIRLEGIRNAIKPKDVAPALFKKTHKGEVEISMSDPAVAPIKDTSASNAEADRIYGVPATRGLARLVEKLRSPSPVGEQKPFHSLDDLLAKMGGTTTVKRSPDHNDSFDDRESKKSRVQEDAPYDVDMHVDHDYSNPVVRSPVDFTSTWEEAADEGFADDTITPIYSPSRSPLVDLDMPPPPPQAAHIWNGIIRMASVGMFNGKSRQIAGRDVGAHKVWEDILPPTVTIEGRIDTRRAKDYVGLQRQSPSKEIVAVEFRPDETSEDAEKNREGFKALFDYFYDKNRYAVVGQNYISVKDMYLVPIKAGESVPEMITVLKNCNVDVGQRSYDCIFGVVILDKNFFVKTSMKAERSSAKRSSKSAHESRKKHAPEPAMKPPAPVAPMIPTIPSLPLTSSLPYTPPLSNAPAPTANIFASLAALSNLQSAASTLAPPTSSVSALLAQLQHQQQPVQQQPMLGAAQVNNIQNILAQLQNANPALLGSNLYGGGRFGQR